MPVRDATAGSYHGTTSANTAEVVTLPSSAREVEVIKRSATGDLYIDDSPDGDDITLAAAGTLIIPDGVLGKVTLDRRSFRISKIVLKSSAVINYSVQVIA